MLLPGSVPPLHARNRSQAHRGIHPLSAFTHRTQKFQPLPDPLGEPPYHYDLETSLPGIGNHAMSHQKLVFHMVGDTGGVKNPDFQIAVADAMIADLDKTEKDRPSFFYHLGDVVYFYGEHEEYYSQFYDPYHQYLPPILAIPGNHDGDPIDASQTSLDGWVRFFMWNDSKDIDPISRDAPRAPVGLPNVFYTLNCPYATIVGLYTNVPEHGSVDSIQQQWFTHELSTAPKNKALIVALHHPVYSFDKFHSGSPRMADVLQQAINDTRRVPNLVLTGHVHDYQRIEKTVVDGFPPTPFLVAGHGGYHNMHQLNADVGFTDPETSAQLVFGDDQRHGYVTLTLTKDKISGIATAAESGEEVTPDIDQFEYPTAAQFLADGVMVNL
jgi:hypothetical protein